MAKCLKGGSPGAGWGRGEGASGGVWYAWMTDRSYGSENTLPLVSCITFNKAPKVVKVHEDASVSEMRADLPPRVV